MKERTYEIIFKSDTPAGRTFDLILLCVIFTSVVTVCLESVSDIRQQYGFELRSLEWIFTLLFTLEYFARIFSAPNRLKYIFSFYGVIDLAATLPTYLGIFFVNIHPLLVIRILRLLRVFRILKLNNYINEGNSFTHALWASRRKIVVFLLGFITIILISATLMYLIEGSENGFDSIPRAIYWAIVTITTVGYGDISPHTVFGQTLASILMLVGYTIIVVPTGIISSELTKNKHCKHCGSRL